MKKKIKRAKNTYFNSMGTNITLIDMQVSKKMVKSSLILICALITPETNTYLKGRSSG